MQKFRPGDVVRIAPKWLDRGEDPNTDYIVLEDLTDEVFPDGRVKIMTKPDWSVFPHVSEVSYEMVYKIGHVDIGADKDPFDSFDDLDEALLDESAKTDFINKFGNDLLDKFDKAKQRLKNNNMSVDYQQYLNMSVDELKDLLLSLYDDTKDAQKKRIISGTDKEIRGKYKYLGESDGYKVYEPLDAQASVDLGVNTGWCTAGRYGHAGHPDFTPDIKQAVSHFEEYTDELEARLFYILDANTMYGVYAFEVHDEDIIDPVEDNIWFANGNYLESTNFKLWDAKDNQEYDDFYKIPKGVIDLINGALSKLDQLYLKMYNLRDTNGLAIKGGMLINYIPKFLTNLDVVLPDYVTSIDSYAMGEAPIRSIIMNSVEEIGTVAFDCCGNLEEVIINDSLIEIGDCAFKYCDKLKKVTLPGTLQIIGEDVFPEDAEELDIYYDGTIEDWEVLTKRSGVGFYLDYGNRIYCTDGYIDCVSGEIVKNEDK